MFVQGSVACMQLRPEESLIRSVVSKAAADGANNVLIGNLLCTLSTPIRS